LAFHPAPVSYLGVRLHAWSLALHVKLYVGLFCALKKFTSILLLLLMLGVLLLLLLSMPCY
jgi:hypothetical protein